MELMMMLNTDEGANDDDDDDDGDDGDRSDCE